nr:protein tyrosine phosphatase family protein [Ramlibacter albus]
MAAVLIPLGAYAQASPRLPNEVQVSPLLVTSGQPPARALAALGEAGFQAVIYLAPSTVPDAVADEHAILQKQGIEFVHVPIPFGSPEEKHYLEVAGALTRLAGKKVLVHCQVNMRASTMMFLYRVIALHEPPERAYEAVARIWSPRGPWRELMVSQLRKHGVAFEPY